MCRCCIEAPLELEKQGLADIVCREFGLEDRQPDLSFLEGDGGAPAAILPSDVTIALVGKYVELHDAYLSVAEALKHGGIPSGAEVNILWVDSEQVTPETAESLLGGADGILIPGGFGSRGVDGKIAAVQYAREHKVPFLGICLGMQVAVIEYARHVLGYADAHSSEIDPTTTHPVIDLMPDQRSVNQLGGTMRLGRYPCMLDIRSKSYALYGEELIYERHRHRYEFNNDFRRGNGAQRPVAGGYFPG